MTALTKIDGNCNASCFWLGTIFLKSAVSYFLKLLHQGVNLGVCTEQQLDQNAPQRLSITLSEFRLGANFERLESGTLFLGPIDGVMSAPLEISLQDRLKEYRIIKIEKDEPGGFGFISKHDGKKVDSKGILITLSKDNIVAWLDVLYQCSRYRLMQFQPYLFPQLILPTARENCLHIPGYYTLQQYQGRLLNECTKPELHAFLDAYYQDFLVKFDIIFDEFKNRLTEEIIGPRYLIATSESLSNGMYRSCIFRTTPHEKEAILKRLPVGKISKWKEYDVFLGPPSELEEIRKSCGNALEVNDIPLLSQPNIEDIKTPKSEYNSSTMITIKELRIEYRKLFGDTITDRQVKLIMKIHNVNSVFEKAGRSGFKAYPRLAALGAMAERAKTK